MPEMQRAKPTTRSAISRNIAWLKSAMYGMNRNQLGSWLITREDIIPPTPKTVPVRNIMKANVSLCLDSAAFSCK